MAEVFQDWGRRVFGPNKPILVVVTDLTVDAFDLLFVTLLELPRRMRLRVISPNHRSTGFSQEELVGVKRR